MTTTTEQIRNRSDIWTGNQKHWEPRRKRDIVEWCDNNLFLSAKSGAFLSGPWDTEKFPYQRGIMWMWAHYVTRVITCMWATQLGKTVLGDALFAWAAHNDPAPMLIAMPDASLCRKHSQVRFQPMFEHVDTNLDKADRLLPEKDKDRQDLRLDLRDCWAHYCWAGSPTATGDHSIRWLRMGELDKWEQSRGQEGDPWGSVLSRVKGWPNHKIYQEGTPTLKGASRLERAATGEGVLCLEYHVPCPNCGTFKVLEFKNISWEKDEKERSMPALAKKTAKYTCPECSKRIWDHQKPEMLREGIWAPADYVVQNGQSNRVPVLFGQRSVPEKVGTHLASWYSPLLTWGDCAEAFLEFLRSYNLQTWENEWAGLPYRDEHDAPGWEKVKEKLSTATPGGMVPGWAIALTAGCDIHAPGGLGNFYTVRAWGYGGKSQLVEAGVVRGEFSDLDGIRAVVATVLDRKFTVDGGGEMEVRLAAVDAGYNTSDVYRVIRERGGHRVRAIMGQGKRTAGGQKWFPTKVDTDPRTGKKYEWGLDLFNLNAEYWRTFVNAKLRLLGTAEDAWLIHADAHDEYIKSVCNVAKVKKINTKKQIEFQFHVLDQEIGDHYHDCEYYTAAAADMASVLMLREPSKNVPRKKRNQNAGATSGFVNRRNWKPFKGR